MTTDKPLMELINERLATDLHDLPVFHSVAVKLQQMLQSRTFRINDVIELISEDQALSGQVLKIANSSFYAGLSKIATIKDAVVRLCAQEIANLVMMASQAESYKSSNPVINSYLKGLWTHALSCAVGAKWLARKSGYETLAQEAFMGGLLHDIGKLALLKVLDTIGRAVTDTLVDEVLERMHEDVGYRLMLSWSLPESYCSIAINHHADSFDTNDILLLIVRLSDQACKKVGLALKATPDLALVSTPEALCLGLKDISLAELEIVIEDTGASLGQQAGE